MTSITIKPRQLLAEVGHLNYSEYVIGCRIGDKIFINPLLKKEEPELFWKILEHEMQHTSSFGRDDFLLDLHNEELKGYKKEYWSFVLRHPKTWVSFLPVTKIGGGWNLDIALGVLWFLSIAGGVALWSWIF